MSVHPGKSQVRPIFEKGKKIGVIVSCESGVVFVCRFGSPLRVQHRITRSKVEELCTLRTSSKTRVQTKAPVIMSIVPFRKLNPCA